MIDKHLNKNLFKPTIIYTEKAQHAIKISSENATKYDIIVAVGGDGSVNEIGKGLINTNTILAIIPTGSGNGLARHLKIPLALKKAIRLIETGKVISIDSIKINDNYFFCTAGVGIDAHISWKFAEATKRGLSTYIKLTLKSVFNYKAINYELEYNNQKRQIKKVMLATFANANQFGNNVIISPNSIINDGFVRLIIVKKFPFIYAPIFAYYMLSKQVLKSRYTEEIKSTKITMYSPEQKIHIDGEPIKMDNKIEVEVIPNSLKVIVP